MAHGGGEGSTMGGKIWGILLLVVIAGVILYLWNSGLVTSGTSGLSSLFPALNASSSAFSSTPPGFGVPNGPPSGSGSNNLNTVPPTSIGPYTGGEASTTGGNPNVNPYDVPAGFTVAQLSPFFHEILFGSVLPGGYGSSGEVTLYTSFTQNETVDVTGWKIVANGGSEYIPQAVNFYQPSGLTAPSDIELANDQTLYLYSSAGTINLRLNECIGYLQNDLRTNPALPLNCPYINQSQISNLSGGCQNYILSIPACTVPNTYSPEIPPNDYACVNYLDQMNYTGCFNAHESDPNFLSNQWWAWTGSSVLNPYHDNVYLYDRNGLLVDSYSY